VTDWADRLDAAAEGGGSVADAFGLPVLDVPPRRWLQVLQAARDGGLRWFDWLSGVDALDEGIFVVIHVADVAQSPPLHLLVRTLLDRSDPRLPSAVGVYRGAAWHERETHEMFGVVFEGHPGLAPLLLPDGFDGHPLRKDFVLTARVSKPWPGAKEPGESDEAPAHGERRGGAGRAAPARRRVQPPGLPDESWGPRRPGEVLAPRPAAPPREARAPREARPPREGRPPRSERSPGAGTPVSEAGPREAAGPAMPAGPAQPTEAGEDE
jgi:NADH-quinone oxidoreductase subunit C